MGFIVGLGIALLALAILWAAWSRNRRVTDAVAEVSNALGGAWGKDRFVPVLDWLDAHWPDSSPLEMTDLPAIFEHRWDVQASHGGHAVLVHVQRRPASRHMAPVRRISFFVSAPSVVIPAGYDQAPAVRALEALGFAPRRTAGGVYASSAGVVPAMLHRDRIVQALDIARSLARGEPPRRRGALSEYS
jgi:hypothetical protein